MSSTKLPNSNCYDALHKVVSNKGFGEHTIDVSVASAKNENFLGDIFRVKVNEAKGSKVLSMIVKVAPADINRDEIPLNMVYRREIFAYQKIFNEFKDLQDKFNISDDLRLKFVDFYYASDEVGKELLILEDLKVKGFERLARNAKIELDHITLMVTYLAKLHALSFALQQKDSTKFNALVSQVPDYTNEVKNFTAYSEKSLDIAADVIDNSTYQEKLKKAKKTFIATMKLATKTDKYSVICHSDCYINNTMFKMQNGRPLEVRLIDYQFARYGSPAIDLVYMLLSSTDGELRRSHYTSLFQVYHSTLTAVLKGYGLDSKEVFPEEELMRQVKETALFGMVAGVALFKSMSLARYEATDAGRPYDVDKLEPPKGAELEMYKKKVTELVEDCVQYGYI